MSDMKNIVERMQKSALNLEQDHHNGEAFKDTHIRASSTVMAYAKEISNTDVYAQLATAQAEIERLREELDMSNHRAYMMSAFIRDGVHEKFALNHANGFLATAEAKNFQALSAKEE